MDVVRAKHKRLAFGLAVIGSQMAAGFIRDAGVVGAG
jgi:hypothetical protein